MYDIVALRNYPKQANLSRQKVDEWIARAGEQERTGRWKTAKTYGVFMVGEGR